MRSECGTSLSPCQTICAGVPVTVASTSATSRSRFVPGKTITELFICLTPLSARRQLECVILDDQVGEQFAAHALDLRARHGLVGRGQIDLDVLTLAYFLDSRKAEPGERVLNGLALRVEDTVLERDADTGFHASLEPRGDKVRPVR